MSRILAVEPGNGRAQTLERLLRECVNATVVVASSIDVALAALETEPPELILISAFTPPRDVSRLKAYLTRQAARIPVLTLPLISERVRVRPTKAGLWSRLTRKPQSPWSAFVREALAARIKEALAQSAMEHSQTAAAGPRGRRPRAAARKRRVDPSVPAQGAENGRNGATRQRAQRWTGSELSWLGSVKLPDGLEVRVVNISSSGLLIQSGRDFMPGTTATFQLWGRHKDLIAPARIIRSSSETAGGRSVRYEVAAAFDEALEIPTPSRGAQPGPTGLADLMAQLTREAERGTAPATLQRAFEKGIQQLVAARQIRLCDAPVVEDDGTESVYFTVPTGGSSPPILQVTFEPHHELEKEELELLEAAARFAASLVSPHTTRPADRSTATRA